MKNKKNAVWDNHIFKGIVLPLIIIGAATVLFAAAYVLMSKNIYYWSTAESWNIAIKIAQGAYSPNLLKEVYLSILSLDVNYLCSLPSALFIKLFGESRLVYILSLVICYVIPSYICIFFLARKIGKSPVVTLVLTLMFLPSIMYMALMGFAEIGGILPGIICMYLYLGNTNKGIRPLRYIVIGFLLTLMILWSNIYIFFATAFVTAMLSDSIISRKQIISPIISLCCVVAIISIFFRSYITTRIINLYGNISVDLNISTNLKFFFRYFGLIFILGIAAHSIWIALKENSDGILFLWMHTVLCFIMLMTTRMHGQLHILLYIPSFAALCVICIKHINNFRLLIITAILALVQFVSVFIPRTQPASVDSIKGYAPFSSFSLSPKSRSSATDILTLKNTLDNIVKDGEYLGVLAYSDIMNPDLLNNAQISLNASSAKRNYVAFTIPYFDSDTTDIAPLCNADYMLVGTPLQTNSDNQKILSCAVDSFINWTDIARSYVEMYEYKTFIDGVEFKLFKRTRNATDFEKREFILKLRNN